MNNPPPVRLRSALAALLLVLSFSQSAHAKNVSLIPLGSAWKYHAAGVDLGTAWREPGFDDAAWTSAPAQLGYGDGDVTTVIATATPRPVTAYFRREFDVANPSAFTALLVRLIRDDGAVVYLNGAEIMRSNMPAGAVEFATPASGQAEYRDEGGLVLQRSDIDQIERGRNVLAVEIHQTAPGNHDLSFDLELVASTAEPAAFVTRGPYLQNATPTQVSIRWRTDAPTASHVAYGGSERSQRDVVSSPLAATEHELLLTGLQPDRDYFYTIGDGVTALEGNDDAHRFRTPPVAGSVRPVRIWVLGDCGTGGDGAGRAEAVRDAYLRSPGAARTDVWLMLGDNAYEVGSDEEYQAAVFDTYRDVLRGTLLWSTLGNHEIYSTNGEPPYFQMFTFPRAGEGGGLPSGTESYYSFDYANVHFVCLDSTVSNRAPGSPMLTWLQADLESTEQKWIIAFWHHPPYSRGSHNSDFEGELIEMRENALPILEAGGVDLVLAGHSHSYERSYLLDGHYGFSSTFTQAMIKDAGDGRADGSGAYGKDPVPRAGAVYVVAGTAGKVSGGSYDHPAMFTSLPVLGSLVLDVDGDQLDASFLAADGETRDHFSISKAPLVTVAAVTPLAAEDGARPGHVTLQRTRGLDSAVAVQLTLGGTATAGADYQTIASPFTIPAGASSVTFAIQPIADSTAEGVESVLVSALGGATYRVHRETRHAAVSIEDKPIDAWRFAHFGPEANTPAIAGDAADPDGDGQANGVEFTAGTGPRDATSLFTSALAAGPAGEMRIRFTAQPDRTYRVLWRPSLTAGAWQMLADVPADSERREVEVADPTAAGEAQRFYRVITPAAP